MKEGVRGPYIFKPWFKDVKELKEVASKEEAESLLATGKWKLIIEFGEGMYSLGRVE